ncbi:MAG TPA: ribosomal protein L7/L12 [Streptosporangiaceae bacterium]|jgi:ribosomal protein L7/L12
MQIWVVAAVAVGVLVVVALVAAVRVRALNRPQPPMPIAPGASADLPQSGLTDVQALLASGKKIAAIKRLREQTGMGLAEAKDVVDAMAAGRPAPGPEQMRRRTIAGAADRAQQIRRMSPATRARAEAFIADRKLIHAIKAIREDTGMGLRDAKETAEAMEAEMAAGRPAGGAAPPREASPAGAADLATRVRELRADDRTGEAIELVATETGMSLVDATRFVESVSQ